MKLTLFFLLVSSYLNAEIFQVPLSHKPVKIDGILDDEIWQDALQQDLLYEISPDNTLDAVVGTKVYIVDRGNSIVFAFVADDPNPEKIQAFLRDRDSAYQDDFVGVFLDTYNDQRRALEFFVNPLGVQMDLIRDESGGGSNENDSWDAIWESAGKITNEGYIVEMEIPYNELQMPQTTGKKTWGINLFRSYPRNIKKQFQSTKLDRNNNCSLCQIDKFTGFANAQRGLDLEITPSITMISRQNREDLEGEFSGSEFDIEPSLDINWGINSSLTLNATFNPDFSQIESDSAQLDVNQTFALYFSEKRPFFLENSDYFSTHLNLVHTRNIADPDYGIRLVGKTNKNAYGFFYTDDTITNILIPGVFGSDLANLERESENIAARYRRDFGNSSTVGALITRRSADNYSNTVASVDSTYNMTNEDTLTFQYVNSDTRYPNEIVDDFDQEKDTSGDAYYIRYRHSDEHWFYSVSHTDYDDGFRSDLGFIGQVGFKKSAVGAQYTWRGDSQNWWNRFSFYSDWDITHDQEGQLLERELEASINLNAGKQSYIGISGLKRDRLWNDVLFDEKSLAIDAEFSPKAGVVLGAGFSVGERIDFSNTKIADREGTNVFANINLGQHLSMRLEHSYSKLKRDGGNVFVANQSDLRFSYQFNIRQRLRLSVINTNVNRDVSLYDDPDIDSHSRRLSNQLIYSYKVNPKTLLFLGYSDSGSEDQNIDLTKTNRTFFAKFSYAWKR